ncbi:acid protease [Lophium mytilinum]|uniref:Acid protease n=1 Tax=Lophium mytilinum TaxID=390894 RepID=A0A6A6QUW9_9PEZI|nr:acid protease [Lophium mytilinum]
MMGIISHWVVFAIAFFFSISVQAHPHSPRTLQAASKNIITPHVLELTAINGIVPPSTSHLRRLLLNKRQTQTPVADLDLTTIGGRVYFTTIQISGNTYTVVIDTGSSDTWLVKDDFQCFDVGTNVPISEEECAFGSPYVPSDAFRDIPNETFNISYADGEAASGGFGTETLTAGGLTFTQAIGVVDTAAWFGDGQSSGLVGLALAHPNFRWNGTSPRQSTDQYTPFFTSLCNTTSIPPIFSLTLHRPTAPNYTGGGLLALGGIPPNLSLTSAFAASPIQLISPNPRLRAPTSPTYQFYATTIDGLDIAPSSLPPNLPPPFPAYNTTLQVIIDSGTTLIYMPNQIASYYNSLWVPPARWSDADGLWRVSCSAKIPVFEVLVGGGRFAVDRRDLVMGAGDGGCMSAVQGSDEGLAVLGDPFLKGVVVVFDVGKGEVRIAGVEY